MSDQSRPVWLSREQIRWLKDTIDITERIPGAPRQTPARSIIRAWFAAPDDAVSVFAEGAWKNAHFRPFDHIIKAGLRALGMPE